MFTKFPFRIWELLLASALLCACAQENGAPSAQQKLQFEGWVSSGGDLTSDSHNPWWVNNTTEVTYCIAIDPDGVKADENEIDEAFQAAVQFWKEDLGGFHKTFQEEKPKKALARVALQTFTKVGCDKNPELKLAFGYEALDAREKMFLSDPTRIVSRAVRTFYNRVTLQGRGFIYFGAEFGPSAISKNFLPRLGKLKESMAGELWAFHGVLWHAMQHETGHLFGIPHINKTLMDEYYLDNMANFARSASEFHRYKWEKGLYFKAAKAANPLFAPWAGTNWTVTVDQELQKHIGLTNFATLRSSPAVDTKLQMHIDDSATTKVVAELSDARIVYDSFAGVARVNLPAEQTVFPSVEELGRNNLVVAGFYTYEIVAKVEDIGKGDRRLRIEIDPSAYSPIRIYGVIDNTPHLFQRSSPTRQ